MLRTRALVAALALAAVHAVASAQPILRTHVGDATFDNFGWSVGAVGDLDGDGVGEYLATSPEDGSGVRTGYVRVFSSRDGGVIHTLRGGSLNEKFGASADGVADLNGDDCPDVLVGVPERQAGGASAGSCRA